MLTDLFTSYNSGKISRPYFLTYHNSGFCIPATGLITGRRIGNYCIIDMTKAVSTVHITFIQSSIHTYTTNTKNFSPQLCNDEEEHVL